MTTVWPVEVAKEQRVQKHLHVHCTCTMRSIPLFHTAPSGPFQGAPMYQVWCPLAQSFLKPEDPMSIFFPPLARAVCTPHHRQPQKHTDWGSVRVTCKFEFGGALCLTCRCVNNFLQTFTRRHVPRVTCRRSTPDRCYRRSGGSVHRSLAPRSRSDRPFGRY